MLSYSEETYFRLHGRHGEYWTETDLLHLFDMCHDRSQSVIYFKNSNHTEPATGSYLPRSPQSLSSWPRANLTLAPTSRLAGFSKPRTFLFCINTNLDSMFVDISLRFIAHNFREDFLKLARFRNQFVRDEKTIWSHLNAWRNIMGMKTIKIAAPKVVRCHKYSKKEVEIYFYFTLVSSYFLIIQQSFLPFVKDHSGHKVFPLLFIIVQSNTNSAESKLSMEVLTELKNL